MFQLKVVMGQSKKKGSNGKYWGSMYEAYGLTDKRWRQMSVGSILAKDFNFFGFNIHLPKM